MKTLSKRMLILIIFFQVITVFYLLFIIVKQQKGSISVNNLNKDNFYYSSNSSELRYMYIPQGNRVEEVTEAWLSEKVTYTFNNDGLHDRNNYDILKKSKVFRIITLGDSFTFGMNVSTYQNWTEQLEDKLNKNCTNNKWQTFEVINLGVSGYDTKYVLERYISKGIKYKPDLIIWMIFDPERNEEQAGLYRDTLKSLSDRELDIKFIHEFGFLDKKVFFREAMEYAIARKRVAENIEGEMTIKFNTDNVRALRNHFHGDLFLVSISKQKEHYEDRLYTALVKDKTASNYISITPHSETLLLDGHLNKDGHVITMNKIFTELKNRKVLSCRY